MRCYSCQKDKNDDRQTGTSATITTPRTCIPTYVTRLFLNPSYTLRKQMLLCYGTAAIVSALFVYSLGCLALHASFSSIKWYAEEKFKEQLVDQTKKNSRNVAELFKVFVTNQEQVVLLIKDLVTERIVGYPDIGWETDAFVPFPDIDQFATQPNRYPLQSKPLPLEWEIVRNVNESNKVEHLQERADYVSDTTLRTISTASASYFMAGICNPYFVNSTSDNSIASTSTKNCSVAHNNVSTGGVVRPTKTNKGLYEKSADIGVLLKPIYESHPEILQIAIHFFNSGASSAVKYPGTTGSYVQMETDASINKNTNTTDKFSYVSAGCHWMKEYLSVTEEDVNRCHPNGTTVNSNEFNLFEIDCMIPIIKSTINDPFAHWSLGWYYTFDDASIKNISTGSAVFVMHSTIFDSKTTKLIGIVQVLISWEYVQKFVKSNKMNNLDVVIYSNNEDAKGLMYSYSHDTVVPDNEVYINITQGFIAEEDFDMISRNLSSAAWNDTKEIYNITDKSLMYAVYPLFEGKNEIFVMTRVSYQHIVDFVQKIQKKYKRTIIETFLVIAVAVLITFVLVRLVATSLTEPLLCMETVSLAVVNNLIDETATHTLNQFKDTGYIDSMRKHSKNYLASTELNRLVEQFQITLNGFSGSGPSIVALPDVTEVKNQITWQSNYQALYVQHEPHNEESSKLLRFYCEKIDVDNESSEEILPLQVDGVVDDNSNNNTSTVSVSTTSVTESGTPSTTDGIKNHKPTSDPLEGIPGIDVLTLRTCPKPKFVNYGSNVNYKQRQDNVHENLSGTALRPTKSKLFWRTISYIIVPLSIAIVFNGFWVLETMGGVHYDALKDVVTNGIAIRKEAQQAITVSTAKIVSEHMKFTLGQLHLMTRIAGWLHFEAITRSDAFTKTRLGYFQCDNETCPKTDIATTVCDCQWSDVYNLDCQIYGNQSLRTRYNQTRIAFGLRRLSRRRRRRALLVADLEEKAKADWWWNLSALPGSNAGRTSFGYNTTYDRIRVSAALSVVDIPLYNLWNQTYVPVRSVVGSMVAFENDGLMTGYRGCKNSFQDYSSFVFGMNTSSDSSQPNRCVMNQRGYDPRCRDWYVRGSTMYNDNTSQRAIHLTPMYKYVSGNINGATVTSPLANPENGQYAGQIMIDYVPSFPSVTLDKLNASQAIVMSTDNEEQYDVLINFNRNKMDYPVSSVDTLLLNSSSNRTKFAGEMRNINANTSLHNGVLDFPSTETDTKKQDNFELSYAKIYVRGLLPMRPSDFSGGVANNSYPLFLVGIVYNEPDIIGSDESLVMVPFAMFFFVTFVATIVFVYVIIKLTVLIIRPMLILLQVFQSVNDGTLDSDFPPLHGGSREIHRVYSSFSKLMRTVRVSNSVFFSGDLSLAYDINSGTQNLFQLLSDEKAEGIAATNVANTLQALFQSVAYAGDCCRVLPGCCVIKLAIKNYNQAIDLARYHLSLVEMDDEKVPYMQILSDRLFNRCLLLMHVYDEACAPPDSRQMALNDIEIVRDLDASIYCYYLSHNKLCERSADHFCRMLRRCYGLLGFYSDEESRGVWDAKHILKEACRFLHSVWSDETIPLFRAISRAGRLQQLEALVIEYMMINGLHFEAASLGMRMLFEDEYINEESFKAVTLALTDFLDTEESKFIIPKTREVLQGDLRKMQRRRKQVDVDIRKCIVFAVEIGPKWQGHPTLESLNDSLLSLYDNYCYAGDSFGLAAFMEPHPMDLSLNVKSHNEGIQRTSIDMALSAIGTSSQSAFPLAMQMIVDSEMATEVDSFILMCTDGCSIDLEILQSLHEQLLRLNDEREAQVHIIFVSFDVEDGEVKDEMLLMCKASKLSVFLHALTDSIDVTFDEVSRILRGPRIGSRISKGVTVESF